MIYMIYYLQTSAIEQLLRLSLPFIYRSNEINRQTGVLTDSWYQALEYVPGHDVIDDDSKFKMLEDGSGNVMLESKSTGLFLSVNSDDQNLVELARDCDDNRCRFILEDKEGRNILHSRFLFVFCL